MRGRVTFDSPESTPKVIVNLQGEIWSIPGEATRYKNDNEWIVAEYLKRGTALFRELAGAFTLVLEDYLNGKLYLVRDKLGTMPLYYSKQDSIFAWGNMMTDILSQAEFKPSANEDVIHEYLMFRYISGKNTLFKGIYEILPAHYLEVDLKKGNLEERQYWDIPYPHESKMLKDNEDTLVDGIEEILIRNVKRALNNSKYHYGIMSSGGVDSSLIVAVASKQGMQSPATFFIGFTDYEGDRSNDAQIIADKYNAIHSNFYIGPEQYASGLIEAIKVNEEPLNHPGHVGRVLFNSHMDGKLNVLLLGEGVDTMFCGSKAYQLLKYGYINNPFRGLTSNVFSLIPPEAIPGFLKRYYMKIRDVFLMEPDNYLIRTFAEAEARDVNGLLKKKNDQEYLTYYMSFVSGCTKENVLEKYVRLNQHPFMVEVLNSEAKFGSMCGMINKYPFLDEELITYANSIPFEIRTKGLTGKYIIKRLAERYLPSQIIYKRKEGFGVPLKKYFSDTHGMGRYYDILTDKRTLDRGIFKKSELRNLVDNFRSGDMPAESYESLLWTTINLELWYRIHIDMTL